jgi:hypothetical protein
MPVSITSETARLENKDGQRCHDESLAIKVKLMSKITLASSSEVWLVNLPGEPFNHFLSNDMEGLGLTGCRAVFQESLVREMDVTAQMGNHYADEFQEDPETRSRDRDETLDAFPMTRSRVRADTTMTTPAANSIISGDRTTTEHETRTITPELENHKIKWKNVPRQPIQELQDVGHVFQYLFTSFNSPFISSSISALYIHPFLFGTLSLINCSKSFIDWLRALIPRVAPFQSTNTKGRSMSEH